MISYEEQRARAQYTDIQLRNLLPQRAQFIVRELKRGNGYRCTLQSQQYDDKLISELKEMGFDIEMLAFHLINPKQFNFNGCMQNIVKRLEKQNGN